VSELGPPPLTVGTAGHIDHGKTALVGALTGVDTDRLPEERERGMTIVLGYAPLVLPSGRRLSLVDVPGHERLVRVMVAGATGIDLFLLIVAADDGVMPQTLEHLRVLQALGVDRGVVAVTKSDVADPGPALAAVAELLPGVEAIACSARTGTGVAAVSAALERAAADAPGRTADERAAVLHVDRSFTIHGAGTVVTGTLAAGTVSRGDRLLALPAGREVRVRGVQVHDHSVERAAAGQRVAVNLTGVRRETVARGDVLAGAGAPLRVAYRIEADLQLYEPLAERERVVVHLGTRAVPARAVRTAGGRWQLRCELPLIIAAGDRLVLRRANPPATLGGGVVVGVPERRSQDAEPPRQGPPPESDPADRREQALSEEARELERQLRESAAEPPNDDDLGALAAELPALVTGGRVVRIGRAMHAHVDAVAPVRELVERVIERDGSITLARLRDELGTSRKYAQAWLEHLDATRVTRRREDDSRVLRGRRASSVERR
jgi:selenocysteine-specific elongation factor